MRPLLLLPCVAAFVALAGCAAEDDDAVTDDSSELVEGRSALERELDPEIAPPAPAVIGRATSDALREATDGATSKSTGAPRDGCTTERFANASRLVVAERQVCKGSEVVRVLDPDGKATATYSDLNRDGKIDRFTGEDGAFIVYGDANFDGKVDLVIERVDRIDDFSTKAYGESYPRSRFIHRVREDRNKNGKLDYEKLVAKGLLPPAR